VSAGHPQIPLTALRAIALSSARDTPARELSASGHNAFIEAPNAHFAGSNSVQLGVQSLLLSREGSLEIVEGVI